MSPCVRKEGLLKVKIRKGNIEIRKLARTLEGKPWMELDRQKKNLLIWRKNLNILS
jgi:hypothetical protein